MMEALDAYSASLRGLDADLARLEAKVDALPTKEWIRGMLVRAVARTAALAAAVAIALGLCFVGR